MPCLCGALDCPDCGPAQGVQLVRRYCPTRRRMVWVDAAEVDPDELDNGPPEDEIEAYRERRGY